MPTYNMKMNHRAVYSIIDINTRLYLILNLGLKLLQIPSSAFKLNGKTSASFNFLTKSNTILIAVTFIILRSGCYVHCIDALV